VHAGSGTLTGTLDALLQLVQPAAVFFTRGEVFQVICHALPVLRSRCRCH
jgi:hypothetical protein